jgi:two-component system phosphate regulon response regulator PhoB
LLAGTSGDVARETTMGKRALATDEENGLVKSSRLEAFVKPPAASGTGLNGKILIVANEPQVASLLAYCLTAAGFRVRLAGDTADGVLEVTRFSPDLVLLESKAPDFGSTDTWRQLRSGVSPGQPQPAVVMFIGSDSDIDPRLGLELGPCDFVLYPFSVRDLVLRVDGIIRARHGAGASAPARRRRYLVGPLELDVDKHTALVDGVAIQVSSLEMRLLAYLVEHRGHIRSREALLADVWGYRGHVTTRTADTHMNRLRTKLGAAAFLIETIRGAGYRLSSDYPIVMKD